MIGFCHLIPRVGETIGQLAVVGYKNQSGALLVQPADRKKSLFRINEIDDSSSPPLVSYAGWKGQIYSIIDPGLGGFLYDGVKSDIRIEEIVWGGVAKDGIPDLIDPPVISASEAEYLLPDDRVFGVSINGEHRAYPLRILNPHEMANDIVGGVPFALAY